MESVFHRENRFGRNNGREWSSSDRWYNIQNHRLEQEREVSPFIVVQPKNRPTPPPPNSDFAVVVLHNI